MKYQWQKWVFLHDFNNGVGTRDLTELSDVMCHLIYLTQLIFRVELFTFVNKEKGTYISLFAQKRCD
jgi:hypothetical protein